MANTTGISGAPLLHTLFQQSDRVGNARSTAEPASAKALSTTASDKTALSSAGGALANASVQDSDDVRTAKVAQISASIANGSYQVPAGAVADKLIQHLLG